MRSRSKFVSDVKRPLRGLRLRLQRQAGQISQVRRGPRAFGSPPTACVVASLARRAPGSTRLCPSRQTALGGERSPGRSEAVSDRAAPNHNRSSPRRSSLPDHPSTGRRHRGRAGARFGGPAGRQRPERREQASLGRGFVTKGALEVPFGAFPLCGELACVVLVDPGVAPDGWTRWRPPSLKFSDQSGDDVLSSAQPRHLGAVLCVP